MKGQVMSDLLISKASSPLTRECAHACAGDEGEGVQETSKSSTDREGLQALSVSDAPSPLYANARTHTQVMRGRGSRKAAKAARIEARGLARLAGLAAAPAPLRLRLVSMDRSVAVTGVQACRPWLTEPVHRLPGESLDQFTKRVLHLVQGTGDVVLHLVHEQPSQPGQKVLPESGRYGCETTAKTR